MMATTYQLKKVVRFSSGPAHVRIMPKVFKTRHGADRRADMLNRRSPGDWLKYEVIELLAGRSEKLQLQRKARERAAAIRRANWYGK
jgi:hypothetical protein